MKDRIIEYLAVRKLRAERGVGAAEKTDERRVRLRPRRGDGAIVALVGPPGVGKTSLGASIARALGRPFARVALGGVRDEAEIRGHRRTYVGARPGRFVRALSEAGAMNPVVLLDEVDKLSPAAGAAIPPRRCWRCSTRPRTTPSATTTSRSSSTSRDVVFIATANLLDTIPGPLLDRMELVRLDGYTEDEKVVIARHHLLPRLLSAAGLRADEVVVDRRRHRRVVTDYTREAGVRSSSASCQGCCASWPRKSGRRAAPIVPQRSRRDVRTSAGPEFHDEVAERTSVPGVATGLAVTGAGGDVLFIEASAVGGRAGADADRSARRRDEGVGADRPLLRARPRGALGSTPVGLGRRPRPRARRGGPQGRPLRRHHDDHRPGQPAHRPAGQAATSA